MGIPTGAGTEVLKRVTTTGDYDTAQTALTVPSDHIYTVLSIIVNEQGSNSELLTLYMTDADNSNRSIYLIQNSPLGSLETFVWNDKFVLNAGDTFKVKTGSASNIDVLISYIDQHF